MFIVVQRTQGTPAEEVYVFDTVAGHGQTHDKLVAFLGGDQASLSLPASGPFPEAPDAPTLNSLRFLKTNGPVLTTRAQDGALEVAGRPDYLRRYARKFQFGPDGGHHHPEQAFRLDELHPDSEMIVLETIDEPEGEA